MVLPVVGFNVTAPAHHVHGGAAHAAQTEGEVALEDIAGCVGGDAVAGGAADGAAVDGDCRGAQKTGIAISRTPPGLTVIWLAVPVFWAPRQSPSTAAPSAAQKPATASPPTQPAPSSRANPALGLGDMGSATMNMGAGAVTSMPTTATPSPFIKLPATTPACGGRRHVKSAAAGISCLAFSVSIMSNGGVAPLQLNGTLGFSGPLTIGTTTPSHDSTFTPRSIAATEANFGNTLTGLSDVSGLLFGQLVSGGGILNGTYISAVDPWEGEPTASPHRPAPRLSTRMAWPKPAPSSATSVSGTAAETSGSNVVTTTNTGSIQVGMARCSRRRIFPKAPQ